MLNDASVRVKGGTFAQRDQVAAILGVDQHHALADDELSGAHVECLLLARRPARAASRSRERKTSNAPASDSHLFERCAQARPSDMAKNIRKRRRRITSWASYGTYGLVAIPKRTR